MLRSLLCFALAIALTAPPIRDAIASEACTRETLRRVVDEAGARLRVITAETQPRILAALRRLKDKRGWTGAEGDEKAAAIMSDARTAELDAKAATLLALVDELSETSVANDTQCSRLAELEAASLELQATVKTKAQYILSKLERETGVDSTGTPAASVQAPPAKEASQPQTVQPVAPPKRDVATAPPAKQRSAPAATTTPALPEAPLRRADEATSEAPARHADSAPAAKPAPSVTVDTTRPAPPAPSPAVKPMATPQASWSTETSDRAALQRPSQAPVATQPLPPATPQPVQGLPPTPQESPDSFTRDEIREATRGFFGTISGGLASVIEHAFSTLGRPTGYVLGNEGGGAFIAGLRYGKGMLFLRDGNKRQVYWHGPSIGYDFGASGSKTMFLVYNLRTDIDIFSGFSGVEGSAYLVGGVGMTVLTDGKVIMAPIRSGLGVRLGANVGYIRFTARPTWNPF